MPAPDPAVYNITLFFFLLQLVQRDMKIYRRAGKRCQGEPQNEQVSDNPLVFQKRFLILIRHDEIPLISITPF
jgi:hypothetical protein